AQEAGMKAPQLVALVHLVGGDAEALAAWVKEHQFTHPQLLEDVADAHRAEFAQARRDEKLSELLREVADYPHDDFTNSLILLSSDEQPRSLDTLRARLAASVPGANLGEGVQHDTGTTYPLTLPGAAQVECQLTIGSGPYATN